MLQFFRKHQKYFFFFITIIIVTTFVFFGTYQAFAPRNGPSEEVLFETLDGKKVRKGHFANLCYFLKEEERFEGGGNFLNDGIITKDLLESRKGKVLFNKYSAEWKEDLQQRHKQEKSFRPYAHPQASFLSAESVWAIFAPDLKANLTQLQTLEEGGTLEGFETKVALYLDEKKFPGALLAHVLRYQERDYKTNPDYRLSRENLNLFGYRDIQDWFGPQFIECCAKTILHGAGYARKWGLKVSRQEVIADLGLKCSKTFYEKKQGMPPHIQTPQALLQAYMNERGLDLESLVDVWQEVLLFRRLFDEVGAPLMCDASAMEEFYLSAHENVELEVTQMAEEFRLSSYSDLKKFESYLHLTTPSKTSPLDISLVPLELAEIEKRDPKLIKHGFSLELSKVTTKELEAKVSVRQTWDWQALESNALKIAAHFPQLKIDLHNLDALDTTNRAEVDQFTRAEIVKEHPEWIGDALNAKPFAKQEVALYHFDCEEECLEGVKDQKALRGLLEAKEEIAEYSQDQKTYYRFKVLGPKRSSIISFEEALARDVLGEYDCEAVVEALYDKLKAEDYLAGDIALEKRGDVVAPYRFIRVLATPLKDDLSDFAKQFIPLKKEEVVSRANEGLVTLDQLQDAAENSVSSPKMSQEEGLYLYKVIAKKIDTTLPLSKMIAAQKMLADEAGYDLFEKMMLSQ